MKRRVEHGQSPGRLDGYSLAELQDLANRVAKQIRLHEQAAVDEARRRIEDIARQVGIPLQELIATSKRKPREGRHRYVNPADANQEWNGLGRQPRWVKAWVKEGRALEALRA